MAVLDLKVIEEMLDYLVLKVSEDLLALTECLAQWDHLVLLVCLASLVNQDRQVPQALQVHPEILA